MEAQRQPRTIEGQIERLITFIRNRGIRVPERRSHYTPQAYLNELERAHYIIIAREGTARNQLTGVYSNNNNNNNNNNNENRQNTVAKQSTPRPTEFSNVQLRGAIRLLQDSDELVTGEQYENAIGLVIRAILLLNRTPVQLNNRESLDLSLIHI